MSNSPSQLPRADEDFQPQATSLSGALLENLPETEALLAEPWLEPSSAEATGAETQAIKAWQRRSIMRTVLAVFLALLALLSPWFLLPKISFALNNFTSSTKAIESLSLEEHREQILAEADARTRLIRSNDWQALHEAEPENPLWFTQLVAEALILGEEPPAEWQQTAAQLDPDNGLLFVTELGAQLQQWEENDEPILKMTAKGKRQPGEFEILDSQRFEESFQALYQALEYPRWESYSGRLAQEMIQNSSLVQNRYQIHPFVGQVDLISQWAGQLSIDSTRGFRLARLLEAEAQRAAAAGEKVAFLKSVDAWKRFVELSLVQESNSVISSLVVETSLAIPLPEFIQGAQQFELTELAQSCENFQEALLGRREQLQARAELEESQEEEDNIVSWSMLSVIAMPATSRIVEDNERFRSLDHQPSVAVERSFVFGSLAYASRALFAWVFAVALVALILTRKAPHQLSQLALALLGWKHWLGLMFWAWLLPLSIFVAFRYLPGLSTLHLNFTKGGGMIADFIPLLLLPLLSLLGACVWMERFLQKRGLRAAGSFFAARWSLALVYGGLILLITSLLLPHLLLAVEEFRNWVNQLLVVFGVLALIFAGFVFVALFLGNKKPERKPLSVLMAGQCLPLLLALWLVSFSLLEIAQFYESWYWQDRDETLFSLERETLLEADIVETHLAELQVIWEENMSERNE